MTRVLFAGLGAMGAPIAARLAGAVELVVFDPRPEAEVPPGATRVGSIAEGITSETVLMLCLPSIAQVETVVDALGTLPALVVDLSTSDPERTRALAARTGTGFVDAPVARGRQAAAAGELLCLMGGTEQDVATARPLAETFATDVVHCGPVGSGQTFKVLNNMVLVMNVHALAEAVAVADAAGLDRAAVLQALRLGSASSHAALGDPGLALEKDDFPGGKFSVAYARKDVGLAAGLAARAGVDLPGLAAAADLLRRAQELGDGDAYYPVMVRALDRPTQEET